MLRAPVDLPVTEPSPVTDTFCSRLVRVDHLGGDNVRLVFAVEQTMAGTGDRELVICAKLVFQSSTVHEVTDLLAQSETSH